MSTNARGCKTRRKADCHCDIKAVSKIRNRVGNGTPLQYSCLENPMDRGAWQATVHGVAKSWTRLSN